MLHLLKERKANCSDQEKAYCIVNWFVFTQLRASNICHIVFHTPEWTGPFYYLVRSAVSLASKFLARSSPFTFKALSELFHLPFAPSGVRPLATRNCSRLIPSAVAGLFLDSESIQWTKLEIRLKCRCIACPVLHAVLGPVPRISPTFLHMPWAIFPPLS